MQVDVMQYLKPDGRQSPATVELPDDHKEAYQRMIDFGCRFEAEVLTTPATSFQFRPKEEVPIFDLVSTGFRVLTLGAGGYQTRVVRLPSLTYPPHQRDE